MSHTKSFTFVCLLATASASTVQPKAWRPETSLAPQVVVQYRPQQEFVSLHEPVIVLFSVRNNLSQPITLTLGAWGLEFFEFSLTSPTGEALEEYWNPGREVNLITIGSGKVEVGPGEEYELPILINRWFHFNSAGTYFLTARLTSNIEVSGGSSLIPQKETIRLIIKPRDPKHLEKVCAGLVREVASAPNAEAAQDPALRLSYIDDPVAIPYLSRLFDYAKLTNNFAVAGLERIGTDDAVRVLLTALNGGHEDRAERSRRALTRMQEHISDPQLKETVKHALAPRPND